MYHEFPSDPALYVPVQSDSNSGSRLIPRRWFLAVIALLLLLPATGKAQAMGPDDIVGDWMALDRTLKLEMFHAGSDYEARMLYGNKLVELDGVTFKSDEKNPDASLRSRSTKGIIFIRGLTWDKGQWTGGTLYDASSGKTYKCKVDLKDGTLQLRGYMGVPAFGQTVVLGRTNDSSSKP
jgi:uncharacterized protein (DUF2147 family)